MTEEDLQFELEVRPRMDEVASEFEKIADVADDAGRAAGERLSRGVADTFDVDLSGFTEEAVKAAREAVIAATEASKGATIRLAVAASDPDLISSQASADRDREVAQGRYNQLLADEAQAQRGPLDYRRKAMDEIADQMRQQVELRRQQEVQDDPDVLRERLRLARQINEAAKARRDIEASDPAKAAELLALKKQIAEVEHQTKLDSLTDQLDPNKIREMVTRENELLAVEKQLANMRDAERERQAPEVATTDFRTDVLNQEADAMERQTVELERQQILLDPKVLERRLELERQTAEVRLAQLKAELNPAAVQQRVKAAREEADIRKKIAEAEAKEKHKQERPGFFERLIADPMKTIQAGLDNLKGMFQGEKGEKDEGVGGLLDRLSETFSGGVGEGLGKMVDKFKEKPEVVGQVTQPAPATPARPAALPDLSRDVVEHPTALPAPAEQPVPFEPTVGIVPRPRPAPEFEPTVGIVPRPMPEFEPTKGIVPRPRPAPQVATDTTVTEPASQREVPDDGIVGRLSQAFTRFIDGLDRVLSRFEGVKVEPTPTPSAQPAPAQPQTVPAAPFEPTRGVVPKRPEQVPFEPTKGIVPRPVPEFEPTRGIVPRQTAMLPDLTKQESKPTDETSPTLTRPDRTKDVTDEGAGSVVDSISQVFKGLLDRVLGALGGGSEPTVAPNAERGLRPGEPERPPTRKKLPDLSREDARVPRPRQPDLPRSAPQSAATPRTGPPPVPPAATAEAAGAAGGEAAAGVGVEGAAAAAGPIGIAVVAGMALIKVAAKAAAFGTTALAKGLGLLGDSLAGLDQTLGPIGVGFDLLSDAANAVADNLGKIPVIGESLKAIVGPLAGIPAVFKGIVETLVGFAAKASPATFLLFQHAVEDVQAVIGQRFVPVLELMTDGVRFIGDVMTTLLPSIEDVREALGPVREMFNELKSSLSEAVGTIGPVIKQFLVANLKALAFVVTGMVKPIMTLVNAFIRLHSSLARLMGIDMNMGMDSSTGAAARQARFSDSDSYREQLQVGAYSQNEGPAQATQAQVPGLVQQIFGVLQQWTSQWSLEVVMDRVARAVRPDWLPALPPMQGAATSVQGNLP